MRSNFGPQKGPRMNDMTGDRRVQGKTPVHKKYILTRLWSYLCQHKAMLFLAAILAVLSNLLGLLGPSLSGKAIDAIGVGPGETDFQRVVLLTVLMVICYLASAVLGYGLQFLMVRLTRKVVCQMRQDVFYSLSGLPVRFFDQHQTGDIISVISYDIDTDNASLSSDFLQVVQSVITVVGSFVMMLLIAPELVLIFAVTVPCSVLLTGFITKKVRPLFRKRSASLGELNGYVEEMLSGQKTTRAYHQEETVIAGFDRMNEAAVNAYTRAEYYGTMNGPSINFINNISLAMISVFGALLYLRGGIGLGDISAFVLYSRKFSGPINETANIIGELQSAMAAAERVFRLIDETPETPDAPDAEKLENVTGAVELQHVNFGYTPEKQILKDFSLNAPSGSLIAIVGPTGAGKTTIINLLMRFYDVDTGAITVDGKEIRGLTRDSLRRAYTMVLQDTWLFYGTIYENIAYGRPGVTREDVERAAKAAQIHSFIMRLPQGYDTVLTGSDSGISAGQKQLLTIARAMLQEGAMLILDEATSNVDTQTEIRIQQAMRELMKDRTCFVIAHRLSTIRRADNILVVRDGAVVEQGTHEVLMEQNGFYAELYRTQFESA